MHRWLPTLVLLACGCSSDSTPLDPSEPDASISSDGGNPTEATETDTASATQNTDTSETRSDTDTSATTDTSVDAGGDADAQTPACEPLGEASCQGFDCDEFSSMDYEEALDDLRLRCDDDAYRIAYAGEGCGYLILKYAFGAGDTFMAFYDPSSGEVVGWRYASDTDPGAACAGDVPTECFEYGFVAPPDGEALCVDAGTPGPDAEAPDADVPDADVPDADVPDADVPDADVPDATPDAALDASDAAQ